MSKDSKTDNKVFLSGLSRKLEGHVKVLSHDIGNRNVSNYKNLQRAAVYIRNQLKKTGFPIESQFFISDKKRVENIILDVPGIVKPKEILLVGAHYDSCYNPGADDNASGIAGLLELVRLTASVKPERTIRFVAFVNEEPPFYHTDKMGSLVYASAARKRNDNIRAAIILEMIGCYTDKPNSQRYPPLAGLFYPDKGNFIAVVSNFSNRWLVKLVESHFKRHSAFPIESLAAPSIVQGVDFSDHWSFWQKGYSSVMITDTAFFRNANYHQPTDTYKTLDYSSMSGVVHGLLEVIKDFANMKKLAK